MIESLSSTLALAASNGEIAHHDRVVEGVSRPTRPYREVSFGELNAAFSVAVSL